MPATGFAGEDQHASCCAICGRDGVQFANCLATRIISSAISGLPLRHYNKINYLVWLFSGIQWVFSGGSRRPSRLKS